MPRICLAILALGCLATLALREHSVSVFATDFISPSAGDLGSDLAPGEDLARALQQDLADRELDSWSLFEAALIAGGLRSPIELQQHVRDLQELRESLAAELQAISSPRFKLDRILHRLHERVLTGEYRAEYSELHRTLEDGHYNCVTATILFQALAIECGLPTFAMTADSHVLCCFPSHPALYTEATCPDWNIAALPNCPESIQAIVKAGRKLNSTHLLGKVYYNLGVTRLHKAHYSEAAELLKIAVNLDEQDHAAQENLLATYNNWALEKCDGGEFELAQQILIDGLERDPRYQPLLSNDLHIHQLWTRELCKRGEFRSAIDVLEQGYQRRPDASLFAEGRAAAYCWWAEHLFVHGDLAAGWNVLAECQQRCGGNPVADREIATVQAAYTELISRRDFVMAAQLLEQTEARYPGTDTLERFTTDLLKGDL